MILHQATKVESTGSLWYIDEENRRYLRMPKEEKPRPNGWGGPDQGELQDLVWHPFIDWHVDAERLQLRIHTHDNEHGKAMFVVAPMPWGEPS